MFIGIDMGGTFTDGILFHEGKIVKSAKNPTQNENLKESLLKTLDELLEGQNAKDIKRTVLSTTLVTNIIVSNSGERTALILAPGRGLPHHVYNIAPDTFFVKGAVDFRGNLIEKVETGEILRVVEELESRDIKKAAVVAKFSNRNQEIEKEICSIIRKKNPDIQIKAGYQTSGKLNFPRRAVTTYYTTMTRDIWNTFADEIEEAFKLRNLEAALDVLKADGGTMNLDVSREQPCETIFSGPAASTMGAVALTMNHKNAVVIDIGGTTTDISLLIEGRPLHAYKGARLSGQYTHINSFALRSLSLGGDSAISGRKDTIEVGPGRAGFAACFGGPCATTTDAFNYRYNLKIGNENLSRIKFLELADKLGLEPDNLADRVIEEVIEKIHTAVQEMFKEWENEPAYKVWEVVNRRKFKVEQLIGIGAAAGSFLPLLARRMGVDFFVHQYSPVANALGACLARPTLAFNLHADTQKEKYFIEQEGIDGNIENSSQFQLEDAKKLACKYLEKIAQEKGVEKYASEAEFFMEEQYNMIRGWSRVGKIFEVGIQISPGLIHEYKGVS